MNLNQTIEARESQMGTRKKILGLIVFLIVGLLSIFGGLFVLQELVYTSYSNIAMPLALFLMVWWFIPLFLLKRGRKIVVTPLLLVDEWHEEFKQMWGSANLNLPIGGLTGKVLEDSIVEALSNRAARSKFALCEEGIVLHPFVAGATLFRWNEVRWFKANRQFQYFDIKVGRTGSYSFWTFKDFEVANKILTEHVQQR